MPVLLRLCRTGAMTVAWLLVVPCFVLLASAIVPVVPWLRIYALSVVPNHIPWLFLWSIVAMLLGMLAFVRTKTPMALALIAMASLTVLATAGVILHLLYVAESNGARIDVVRALSLREFSSGASSDESRVYARPLGEPLWLDIYRPHGTAPGTLSPVLLAIHGGGFVEGSRKFGAANLRWYADHGWTVLSIDYRLARVDRPTWNLATQDVACALAWTAAHAQTLGIDIDRLTLTGGSAGGSLAMTAAFAANAGQSNPACGPRLPHVATVIVKVPLIDAVGSWYYAGELRPLQRSYLASYLGGAPDVFPERYSAVDLRHDQRSSNPPVLILGGAADPLVPPEAATEFTQRANAAGNEVRQILFPYSGHDFNTAYDSITNQALLQIIAQFMIDRGAGPAPPHDPRRSIADRPQRTTARSTRPA